ncbi:hypothetical protein UPYG_G00279340 [Umbra pygmaea]|uniref:Ubiquitin-like-conjugating enzyme ATG10 n=1 Tax=Umbra pygmaea TaxID=75934 RepID=A0ABD0W3T3_UMBPY
MEEEEEAVPVRTLLANRHISPEMSSCFLDEEKFRQCCQLFLEHSDSLSDGWRWESVKDSHEGYLRKTALGTSRRRSNPDQISEREQQQTSSDPHQEKTSLSLQNNNDGIDDGALCCLREGSSGVVIQYEYHILYSNSYQTPVLYFRASTLDGKSLSLEDVWDSVHSNYRQRLQNGPWDTITQQEHPLLGQSFFVLHPCRTEEFMRPVMQAALEADRQVNYVVTWLSVVGPVVGLDVPLSYCTQVPAVPHCTFNSLHPAAVETSPD